MSRKPSRGGFLTELIAEILYRRGSSLLTVLAVAAGVTGILISVERLDAFDRETDRILATKKTQSEAAWKSFKNEMRKDMLRLGFNLVILHEDHDISAPDNKDHLIPEDYAMRLAENPPAIINHVLPFLEESFYWEEQRRWVTLVGTGGQIYIKNPRKQDPMMNRIQPGNAILGAAIHESLGLSVGDRFTFNGREFTVQECLEARNRYEDEQLWVDLATAQDVLGHDGMITGMTAINCMCTAEELLTLRSRIAELLPGTRLVEDGNRIVTRAEVRGKTAKEADADLEREAEVRSSMRASREQMTFAVSGAIVSASVAFVAILMWINAVARRIELAVQSALGIPAVRTLALFGAKGILLGGLGSGLGILLAWVRWSSTTTGVDFLTAPMIALLVAGAALLSSLASVIPARLARRADEARVLQGL